MLFLKDLVLKMEDIILRDRLTDPLKNSLANVIYDILREADKVYSNYNGKVSW
ncbi:hypothetical protein [Enterococcus faecium]|uniref:hypothetical protein n=1 Tax=Enterococcus faecium TaxID=1352 RepID=UPI001F5B196B|nr:hypothetical protein [Enterococcus faecium]